MAFLSWLMSPTSELGDKVLAGETPKGNYVYVPIIPGKLQYIVTYGRTL